MALVLGGTAGCSGDDDPEGAAPASTPSTETPSATPSPSATPTRTSPTPPASPTPDDQLGDGDPEDDGAPATAGGGVCGDLDPEEVAAGLGETLRGSALGGGPGCTFVSPDGRRVQITVVDRTVVAAGGIAGAKAEATSTVEGTPEDLPDYEAAFVVTGPVFGGTETQGAGAVQVGDRLVLVTVTQHKAVPRARVRGAVLQILDAIADELGG